MSIKAMNDKLNAFIDSVSGLYGVPTPYEDRKEAEEEQIERFVKLANMNVCTKIEEGD